MLKKSFASPRGGCSLHHNSLKRLPQERRGGIFTGRRINKVFLLYKPLRRDRSFNCNPIRLFYKISCRICGKIPAIAMFILYHPLNARYFYPPGYPMFRDWRFLVLAGLLGITCAVSYGVTRSLWVAVSLHWLAVITWLFVFGGYSKLYVIH